ncbi:MAG: beta-phosphoglucomutase [Oscillospiraceae bacterium]|nr:beta-phosphoglucomutase [Oscillospiraceae bacterium]
MRYAGVIFDLDGVICHTDDFHYKAWKSLADSMNIYFDEEINNRLRGVSRMESLDIILERYHGPPLSNAEKLRISESKNMHYKNFIMQMDESYVAASVLSTLHELRENGVKLAIGSSSKNARLILDRIGLGSFFNAVTDGNDIEFSKPHPQVFLLAADKISLSPGECLVVEDAFAGIEAAVAGGFDCVAIGDATRDVRATYTVTDLEELPGIILRE